MPPKARNLAKHTLRMLVTKTALEHHFNLQDVSTASMGQQTS